MQYITDNSVKQFKKHLQNEEKSEATIEKYIRDITCFKNSIGDKPVIKDEVLRYKQELIVKFAPASVNSIISSLNSFFEFMEWYGLRIKSLKVQKKIFSEESKSLTRKEYERLKAMYEMGLLD